MGMITLAVFIPLVQAQESSWSYGGHITPQYTIPIYEDSELSEEDNRINFKVGFDVFYDLSNVFQVKTGLGYHNFATDQRDYTLTFGSDFLSDPVDQRGSWIAEKSTIAYLGIPIAIRRKLTGQTNHWAIQRGLALPAY